MYGRLPKGVPPAAVTNLGPLATGTLKKNEETRQVLQLKCGSSHFDGLCNIEIGVEFQNVCLLFC